MDKIPKHIKAKLRKLMDDAYDHELARELEQLAVHFDKWRAGKISAGKLSDHIHQYHNGASRELYLYYSTVLPQLAVARAVAAKILPEDAIPVEVWPYIDTLMQELAADH